MRKVGLLMGPSDPDARARVKALRQRLGELGWSEDRNTRIDVVWGAADADHVRADAAELIRESQDIIVTLGPVPTMQGCPNGRARLATMPRSTGSGTCTNTIGMAGVAFPASIVGTGPSVTMTSGDSRMSSAASALT